MNCKRREHGVSSWQDEQDKACLDRAGIRLPSLEAYRMSGSAVSVGVKEAMLADALVEVSEIIAVLNRCRDALVDDAALSTTWGARRLSTVSGLAEATARRRLKDARRPGPRTAAP